MYINCTNSYMYNVQHAGTYMYALYHTTQVINPLLFCFVCLSYCCCVLFLVCIYYCVFHHLVVVVVV